VASKTKLVYVGHTQAGHSLTARRIQFSSNSVEYGNILRTKWATGRYSACYLVYNARVDGPIRTREMTPVLKRYNLPFREPERLGQLDAGVIQRGGTQ
jgi:hypothetical protein